MSYEPTEVERETMGAAAAGRINREDSPSSPCSPCRIQRKRTKGWRMPQNTVYVGRPGKYGNPFKVGDDLGWGKKCCCRAEAVRLFEEFLSCDPTGRIIASHARSELRGKNLACFCPLDQPCHADVLLRVANVKVLPPATGSAPPNPG